MDLFVYQYQKVDNATFTRDFKNYSEKMKKAKMIPYGNPILSPTHFIQLFVNDERELNDKFLELFLDELKYIPASGSAYLAAKERFNANDRLPTPPPLPSSPKNKKGGKSKKHKMKHNKKTKKNCKISVFESI